MAENFHTSVHELVYVLDYSFAGILVVVKKRNRTQTKRLRLFDGGEEALVGLTQY